ncbi:GntR family transcriptional regulator [Rhodococcus sp. 06-156-3C]|uniref:GntR family transcriptional regulator n=1 Tax=Nocardiaceae TaxID=85025 RepID=UPI0005230E80|nr:MULTISPECIES: GntR family transcriptional regulator [Rhodococcus]OZD18219.1 GntR family transcriptional regulator [Rhodococcus sp. 06-156-4C]OZD18816.1 GntR family transcriptional regulator [Rhodococcus sp. 06-156-3C]OZD22326.1 GntR family transcriptional regulator [Rhodococcus sp. 06-156-4a]OZD34132.1 GntR family transcriptional regulator [Rhodococcus sp. 06-156-3b]OZD38869.1 GntR family transcriptional regulator [Rhodococcus sp. 06-156-3]
MSSAVGLQRASLRDQALAVIREGLVSGALAPGNIYSATALAAELGVSASPVREAMLTLVNQGLMEAVRNRGFRVVPLTDSDLREISQLRSMIEVPATVELAAHPDLPFHYPRFRVIATEIIEAARAGDLIGYLDADRRFHLGLLEVGGNTRLLAIVDQLRDSTRLFGLKRLYESGDLLGSAEEHLSILDALIAQNGALVRELMHRHFDHITGDWAESASLVGTPI